VRTIERPGIILPAVEDITRRDFFIGGAGLLALGLAGCGRGETGDSSGETRTVESPIGPVEIPVNPKRVVPGYTTEVDYALVLDLPLAAATGATGSANQPIAGYQPEDELQDLPKVTTYPEANYEQIAAVGPDCILDQASATDEARYERLSQIAPTFVFRDFDEVEGLEYGRPNWRHSLRTVGGAFSRRKVAEDFVAGYEARAEDLRERLAGRWSGATFAVLLPVPPNLYVDGRESHQPCQILFEDLGLAPAPFLKPDSQELSPEKIPQIDADAIFLRLRPKEGSRERDREEAAPILNSPLWKRLPAVREGRVYEFDQELTYTGPLTAEAFLDVVERSLLS